MMSAKTYSKRKKPITSTRNGKKIIFLSCSIPDVCASSGFPKKGNLERHFTIMHNKYTKDFSVQSELRKKSLKY